MGHQLAAHKFDISVNPGGTLFNPVSIARLLRMALDMEEPDPFRSAEHLPVWHHMDLHSDSSRATQKEAEQGLDQLMTSIRERLVDLDLLILTFGTARAYTLDGKVVANCHQYPHRFFERRLLSVEEMLQCWQPLQKALLERSPNLQILLTVSPVRHTRDGLPANGVSKALLRVFCEEWGAAHYFPAYEILMDDLRDYRFYEADMVHPNETAQEYIWEAFQESVMEDTARKQVQDWAQIRRDLNHKPRYPGSQAHVQFLESIQNKLRNQPDFIDVAAELELVAEQLKMDETRRP